MIWHIIRYWITFLLPTFYKRIQGKNIKNLKVDGPVIIAMNHPNAFTDPILITYLSYPLRVYYLARGDAFKPGLIAWLLEQIGIVPIFRMQDGGREGLKKNDEAYKRVNYLLGRNAKIIVFAEGICVQERRLRPLKKGVARMIFGAYEAINNDKLVVVPIGINYSSPDKFRSTAFYNIGDPIYVKDFIEDYKINPAKTNNLFLQVLEPKMKALVSHINDKENDELVFQLEELCKKDWLKQQNLDCKNLEHDLIVLKQLVEKVNDAAQSNNPFLSELKTNARIYFDALKKNKIRDWLINPNQNKHVKWPYLFSRCLFLAVTFPLYLIGLTGNYLPLAVTHILTKKMIKNREFYSSIALGLGMFVFLTNYLIWFFVSYAFSETILWPLVLCLGFLLCGRFSLYYRPFMVKTFGMTRILRNKILAEELAEQRGKLLSLINKI